MFQGDDQVPADLVGQLQDRGLGVESVEQEEVEETTAVQIGDLAEQAQGGCILTLAGLQPLQRHQRLDRAADDLEGHQAMVVLHLFDFETFLAAGDATLQTGVAAAAVAGKHLDAVESRHDAALHPTLVESFTALQGAIDVDQHPL